MVGFVKGTLVTCDKPTAIEKLKVGSLVRSLNMETGNIEDTKVIEINKEKEKTIYLDFIHDKVSCGYMQMFKDTRGRHIQAVRLNPRSRIETLEGSELLSSKVGGKEAELYSLKTEAGNYFIANESIITFCE